MTKSDIGKGYRQWFRNVDVGEWCRGELDKAAKLGRIKPSDECRANPRVFAPSLWHYTHYRLARIALEVGEGRKIESSDEHDARHYAAAATYGGILVTGDTVLRKACLMIGEPALRIMNMREAHLELERLLAATGECSPRP